MASLTERLSAHGMDSVAMVIESHASGGHPELCAAKHLLSEFRQLLVEAQDAVAGIETGTLSVESAEVLCGYSEMAPETLRSMPCATIAPPEETIPCAPLPELLAV